MNLAAAISLLIAICKAIPALNGLAAKLMELERRRNDTEALKRRDEKKAAARAKYGAAPNGVHPSPPE